MRNSQYLNRKTTTRLEAVRELKRLVIQPRPGENHIKAIEFDSVAHDGKDEYVSIIREVNPETKEEKYYLEKEPSSNDNVSEKEISLKDLRHFINIFFERMPVVYVNAYEVERCYGGPEEGGWYFNAGYPIASVPVLKKRAGEVIDLLEESLGSQYEDNGSIYSVVGGPELNIYVEDHKAEPWPKRRPHYE